MESILNILKLQAYQLLTVIPALLKAAVVFLVGYVIARVLYQVIRRIVAASGLDRLTDKLLSIDMFRNTDIRVLPSRVLAGIVYYFVLIVFTMAAVDALGMPMLSAMMADLVAYIPNAITAFIILIGGIFLADFIKRLVVNTCRSLGIPSANLIAGAVFYFILLNIVLIALSQAQLQTEFMEANISIVLGGIAGAFAIGYGMASRHIMGNILASFYNRNQVRVGDEISIDGKRGEVIQLSSLHITLRAEESDYTIPFSKLSSDGFEVHSRREDGRTLPPHPGE
ncbi:mechanosensitive ion channel domain-containing protein [Lewinella sp. JB7]|uniref:mechanosensitive ion channel family protein n=1 Tax=Lewinella sp. JB7 TaxID=2962887 RepID=UPI0020C9DE1C|nr:mechanosensitive ion channel domain-containing protein [Lewinella sp. JB7]MCP9236954.1 mechanosensitive ion channel [Lewinella sp. JB7]